MAMIAGVPAKLESTLAAFVDGLLPGDGDFPVASAVGTHRLLADRIRARWGDGKLAALVSLIVTYGPWPALGEAARSQAVRRLAHEHGAEFVLLRDIAYLSYYESAEVIQAIRALGHDYHAAPQPEGYRLQPFAAAHDAPTHRRGSYRTTAAVTRVDLSALGDLDPSKGA